MNKQLNFPFYARLPLIFISLFAIIYGLYIAQDILISIVMATIFAVLLNPITNYLESKKFNKFFAIALTVFIGLLLVSGLLLFLISQATSFSEALPILKQKFNKIFADVITWIAEQTHVKSAIIQDWIQYTQKDQIKQLKIGEKISNVGNVLVTIILLPVYMVMILYYKPLLLEFFRKLFI